MPFANASFAKVIVVCDRLPVYGSLKLTEATVTPVSVWSKHATEHIVSGKEQARVALGRRPPFHGPLIGEVAVGSRIKHAIPPINLKIAVCRLPKADIDERRFR